MRSRLVVALLLAACSEGVTGKPAADAMPSRRDLAGPGEIPDPSFADATPDLAFWPVDARPRADAASDSMPNDAAPVPADAPLPLADGSIPPRRDAAPPLPEDAAPPPDTDALPQCRLNSDCPPGQYCGGEGLCTFDCRENRDCAAGERCQNGRCGPGAPEPDQGVGPPPFDCRRDGCPGTDVCNQATGACAPAGGPGNGELGAPCERDADCNGTYCLGIGIAGEAHRFCTYLCCTEGECPIGFACGSADGPKFCIPSEIFPGGAYSFDAAAGQSCGRGGGACQSMICDTGRDRCERTCCTDADCGGLACIWQANRAQICDIPIFGFGRTGDSCEFQLELDCMSLVCLLGPNGPVCADMCCSNRDCPNGFACQQVIGPEGDYISACAPTERGLALQGEGCASDAGCQSGLCITGECAEPCCEDAHCPGGQRCDLADNGQNGYIRICKVPAAP